MDCGFGKNVLVELLKNSLFKKNIHNKRVVLLVNEIILRES